jgi:hypothetical protein
VGLSIASARTSPLIMPAAFARMQTSVKVDNGATEGLNRAEFLGDSAAWIHATSVVSR